MKVKVTSEKAICRRKHLNLCLTKACYARSKQWRSFITVVTHCRWQKVCLENDKQDWCFDQCTMHRAYTHQGRTAETCYTKRINFKKLVLVFAKEVWENKRNIMIYSTLHTACLRGFLVVLQSPSLLTSLISLDFWTMNRRRILNGVCRPKFGPGPSRNVSRAVFLNCYLHLHRHLWSFEKTLRNQATYLYSPRAKTARAR